MCVGQEPTFSSVRSAFFHEGAAKRLVTAFKYDGLRALGRTMAESAADEFRDLLARVGPSIVTWVPAHASNTRARGYNQAEVFARELAQVAGGVPVAPLVRKVRATGHQRELGREGRSHNLRGAFVADVPTGGWGDISSTGPRGTHHGSTGIGAVFPVPQIEGVVLVDDVFTTGATAAEVSRALVVSSGIPVHVFTFGRAPADLPQRAD